MTVPVQGWLPPLLQPASTLTISHATMWNWRLLEPSFALSTSGTTMMLPTAGETAEPLPPSEKKSPISLDGAPAPWLTSPLKLLLFEAVQSGEVGVPLSFSHWLLQKVYEEPTQ